MPSSTVNVDDVDFTVLKFCVYHPGVFSKLNKISQFQSITPFVFISLLYGPQSSKVVVIELCYHLSVVIVLC